MNRGDRAEAPLRRDGDRLHACDWDAALADLTRLVAGAVGGVVLLAGGRVSCESLGWMMRLLGDTGVTAAMKVPLGDEHPIGSIPNLALRPERAGNLEGARLLGITATWASAIAAASLAGLVVVLDVELDDADVAALTGTAHVVQVRSAADMRLSGSALVLPTTTMAEEQGVFVNRDRRAQRFLPARSAPGMARPAWWIASQGWARRDTSRSAPSTAAEAFAALAPFAGLTYRDLGLTGRVLTEAAAGASR
jgi:NADH dehydrogenase/NADH:ubiquinone oxidoreductase subunit G